MRRSGWRLAISAVLFAGWIGYLAYLAATASDPIVLSRPQFLVADVYVIADLKGERFWQEYPGVMVALGGVGAAGALSLEPVSPDKPGDVATVREVIWSAQSVDLKDKKVFIKNLQDFGQWGWRGPGPYVIPLSHEEGDGPNVFEVTLLPKTPGFPGSLAVRHMELQAKKLSDHIYPLTPLTRKQAEKLAAEFHTQKG